MGTGGGIPTPPTSYSAVGAATVEQRNSSWGALLAFRVFAATSLRAFPLKARGDFSWNRWGDWNSWGNWKRWGPRERWPAENRNGWGSEIDLMIRKRARRGFAQMVVFARLRRRGAPVFERQRDIRLITGSLFTRIRTNLRGIAISNNYNGFLYGLRLVAFFRLRSDLGDVTLLLL